VTPECGLRQRLAVVLGWNEAGIDVQSLPGGSGARTLRVDYAGERYVVRAGWQAATEVRPRMSVEPEILKYAAAAGVGPELVHADPQLGLLVTRYIDGRVWDREALRSTSALEALARLLRRIHTLPRTGEILDVPRFATAYRQAIGVSTALSATADRCVSLVRVAARLPFEAACCHNDVVAANVVQGRVLRMIDWEYACDNDPLFDLASVIAWHDLPGGAADVLLQSYSGGADGELRARLRERIRLFDALQWLWLAARQASNPGPELASRLAGLADRIDD